MHIRGLAEDGCIPCAASCRAAGLETAIQKDVWHPLADTLRVILDALREMTAVDRLEKRLRKRWTEAEFAERLLDHVGQLRFRPECLWDAVERLDLRSGEIRDRVINQWLLTAFSPPQAIGL